MNCVFIFIMQVALSWIAMLGFWDDRTTTDKKFTPNEIRQREIDSHTFTIIITRLICAIILHFQIEGEVYQAIKMMKFTIYRTGGWNRRLPQFAIATMQLMGALLTQGISLYLMCSYTRTQDIIMNLLAFCVIAEIDDHYANHLKNSFARYLVEEGNLCFSKLGRESHQNLEVNQAGISKFILVIYSII